MVTVKDAANFREQLKKPDLVFLTGTNEQKIKHLVAPQVLEEIRRKKEEAK